MTPHRKGRIHLIMADLINWRDPGVRIAFEAPTPNRVPLYLPDDPEPVFVCWLETVRSADTIAVRGQIPARYRRLLPHSVIQARWDHAPITGQPYWSRCEIVAAAPGPPRRVPAPPGVRA